MVLFLIFSLLSILSIFGAAGNLGQLIAAFLIGAFGWAGYLTPFIFAALGVMLWRGVEFRVWQIIGIFAAFIFIPGFLGNQGGFVGEKVNILFQMGVGEIGAFFLLFGLSIISLVLIFNFSFRQFFKDWQLKKGEAKVNEPRVSVFNQVKDRFGHKKDTKSGETVQVPVTSTGDVNWEFPPIDLLNNVQSKASAGNIAKNVEIIQKTLKDFGIEVSMGDVNIGPTVTQYSLKPSEGVKLNQIVARGNDLALALAAHPIRIEAPIPGKSAVGIEIPNKIAATVTLREVLETDDFKESKLPLSLAIGRDVAGAPFVSDLTKMPHLLIAGATGSGKSIGLNAIILSLLYRNSPSDLRLILVDPKRVEFSMYNNIPHLLSPVITEPDKTVNVLRWVVSEMDRRFKLFQETHRRDIDSYNSNPPDGKLPYIVVVIDELADLMAQSANEVEAAIVRLAQMARATGIHLIVATQRPSVDVITGLIKANITTRVAFAVASQIDSRTILDIGGAEKLLGNGDMLYLGSDLGKPKRIQGVMVTENEIKAVTKFLRDEREAIFDDDISEFHPAGSRSAAGELNIDDDLYSEAKDLVIQSGKGSASLLQRRLRVGYARAARLLDILEADGIIGPADGSKPREVLVDSLDYNNSLREEKTEEESNRRI